MKFTRTARVLLTQLKYIRRGLTWPEFALFVSRRVGYRARQRISDPGAFKAKWRSMAAPSAADRLNERVSWPAGELASGVTVPERTINWVMPDFGTTHGGHLNIFRFMQMIESQGYRCRVYIDGNTQFGSAARARTAIRKHFGPVEAEVVLGSTEMAPAEFTFATTWWSAYAVRRFADTKHKCYFVQDFEPAFFPAGSEYIFAENTYRFGFTAITAGTWLAEKLHHEYGARTFPLGFSYDKRLYSGSVALPKVGKPIRIFFYARPTTPRRGFDVGVLVLAEVARRHPDVEIVMAGWDLSAYDIPFKHNDLGALSHSALPALFESCDIALVLSYSNLSLLPLELMACGCAVVSNRGPNVEWLLSEANSVLVDSDIDALAGAICRLIEDPAARAAQQRAGLEFAAGTDWRAEGARFHAALEQIRAAGKA